MPQRRDGLVAAPVGSDAAQEPDAPSNSLAKRGKDIPRLRPAGWWAFGVFPGCSRVAAGDGGDGFIIAGGEQ